MKPDFTDYLTMLIKLFNCVISQPDQQPSAYKCVFNIKKDNTGELYFNQVLDFKNLCLLVAKFEVEQEDRVKLHIKYRHKVAKLEYHNMVNKLAQVCKVIEEKNPSLIKELCK